MNKLSLTVERLQQVLAYDQQTGVFRWRIARGNGIKPGDIAGRIKTGGYRQISVDGCRYGASRLAWLYVNGSWPTHEIDHNNGLTSDDRIENLRDVTHSGNVQNIRHANCNNKLGFLGVSMEGNKFRAQITINGGKLFLGNFSKPEEAHAAYLAAKRELHSTCTI